MKTTLNQMEFQVEFNNPVSVEQIIDTIIVGSHVALLEDGSEKVFDFENTTISEHPDNPNTLCVEVFGFDHSYFRAANNTFEENLCLEDISTIKEIFVEIEGSDTLKAIQVSDIELTGYDEEGLSITQVLDPLILFPSLDINLGELGLFSGTYNTVWLHEESVSSDDIAAVAKDFGVKPSSIDHCIDGDRYLNEIAKGFIKALAKEFEVSQELFTIKSIYSPQWYNSETDNIVLTLNGVKNADVKLASLLSNIDEKYSHDTNPRSSFELYDVFEAYGSDLVDELAEFSLEGQAITLDTKSNKYIFKEEEAEVVSFYASYDACGFLYEKLAEKGYISPELGQIHINASEDEVDIVIQPDCEITPFGKKMSRLIGYELYRDQASDSYVFSKIVEG